MQGEDSYNYFENYTAGQYKPGYLERLVMNLLAIDPGNETSGVILMEESGKILETYSKYNNEELLIALRQGLLKADHVAVEMIASYGLAVRSDVFVIWEFMGRVLEAVIILFFLVY